jgi:hypothetical protein
MAVAAERLSASDLVLDRYRPVRPLGSGGSGSVWLARDERTGLDVALKIVSREGKAGPRAEREAAALSRLRHERCLRAYAAGTDPQHVYVAYEYVPGQTLRQALRAGELSDATAVEAAAQVLDGLAHAHARGIVHRDVKPANVLLADADDVSVRLLDFGLAQLSEADTLTATGDVPGTLAYISPERLRGEPGGPATDVWSVGVLLWEALAGWHPFWAPSLVGTARKIEAGAPALGTARPDLPRRLASAVDQALALDPRRRPAAMQLAHLIRDAYTPRPRRAATAAPRALSVRNIASRVRVEAPPLGATVKRVAPPAAAALFTGWTAAMVPFYPEGAWLLFGAAAAGLTLAHARLGLALALAVPLLPLGNFALAAAVLYAVVAAGWLGLSWREPRAGLAFLLGPVLAPLAAIALLPLVLQNLRGTVRRALQGATAVLAAALAGAVTASPLPQLGDGAVGLVPPGADEPIDATERLLGGLVEDPSLMGLAVALGAGAAVLPAARRRGPWAIAAFGAVLLAALLLPPIALAPLPAVLAVWITCGVAGIRAAVAR